MREVRYSHSSRRFLLNSIELCYFRVTNGLNCHVLQLYAAHCKMPNTNVLYILRDDGCPSLEMSSSHCGVCHTVRMPKMPRQYQFISEYCMKQYRQWRTSHDVCRHALPTNSQWVKRTRSARTIQVRAVASLLGLPFTNVQTYFFCAKRSTSPITQEKVATKTKRAACVEA